MKFTRTFAMPSADTFTIKPICAFVKSYLASASVSIDPFARNSMLCTHRNDLNPNTNAEHHMDAEKFLLHMAATGVKADLVIFDPPYSPRQISECYQSIGEKATDKDTQNAALYRRVRDAIVPCLTDNGIVLSFGWNSTGMGSKHGFDIIEILMVCHGGGHNDTICIAERRSSVQSEFQFD